ncbi:MAG: malectin domain-containing carbohydrate-binding protein, partial [Pseudomonadota bacterium]
EIVEHQLALDGHVEDPATGAPLQYEIPVTDGDYTVELHFAEIFQSAPGSRVFDVTVEGQLVLDGFDILAETGGDINQPVVIELPDSFSPDTAGNPGALDIDLSGSVDNAKISGIVVRDAGAPPPTGGAATLTVNNNANNIEVSNFGNGSFAIANVGSKDIEYIEIDVTDALLPDAVFDPFGLAGDTTAKILTLSGGSDGGTGLVVPAGGFDESAIGITYLGTGGTAGFEKIRLEFNDFNPGESISFGVDMDPNSIAGAQKATLDSGAGLAGAGGNNIWDVGGIGGAELSGSTFTVGYADATTSVGQLQGQGTGQQMGAEALSSQDSENLAVALTVNGLGEGAEGTYGDGGPQILVQGPAGETARVLVAKGFIVPFTNEFPESGAYHSQLDAQIAALEASGFPANNMVEMLYVDVTLDGTVQDISGLFDFTQVAAFDLSVPDQTNEFGVLDEAQLPLAIVASVIDTASDQSKGPVTSPIHLTYAETPEADLSLAKTVDNATPDAGDDVFFTLTVTNDGTAEATGVTVGDLLANGYAFVSAEGDGSYDAVTGVWDIGAVADGATASLTIQATVLEGAVPIDTVVYRINPGGTTQPAADGSPIDWLGDTLGPQNANPALSGTYGPGITLTGGNAFGNENGAPVIDLSGLPAGTAASAVLFETERFGLPPQVGGLVTPQEWDFEVENGDYTVNLYFAEIFQTTPGSREFDVEIEGALVLDDYDIFADAGADAAVVQSFATTVLDGNLDIDFTTVTNNAKISAIEVISNVSQARDYANYAEILTSDVLDPDSTPGDGSVGDDDDATVVLTPVTTADLALTKTVSDPTPAFGDTITFTLTVDHQGGLDASGVSVEDLLPDGFAYVSDTGGGAYDPGTGIWTIGDIAADGSASLEITATVNAPVTPEAETVLFRVNAGGAEAAASDGGIAWSADTQGANSPFLVNPGSNNDFPVPASAEMSTPRLGWPFA